MMRFNQFFFMVVVTLLMNKQTACEQKPFNILYVVKDFPKLSETFILNQVTGLLDAGHNVYVYTKKPKKGITHEAYYEYNLRERVLHLFSVPSKMKAFFKKTCFDIVLCHFGDRGLEGRRLIEKYKIHAPLITVFHGIDMSKYLDENPTIYDELFPYLDMALPISNFWRNKFISLGYDPKKIRVQYMGVDCDKFTYQVRKYNPDQPIRFMTVARFVEKKGIQYGLQAFAQLAKEHENIEYILIGDGPLNDCIKKLIKKLGITAKVQLLGNRTQQEIQELSKAAHIFLAPCITANNGDKEGIPVSIMEAMAMGLPVISTYHSGIPELVVDGVTGYLVNEKDVEILSEKMRYLINNSELWPGMGQAGRDRVVEHFNAYKQNDRLIETFRECIERRAESLLL